MSAQRIKKWKHGDHGDHGNVAWILVQRKKWFWTSNQFKVHWSEMSERDYFLRPLFRQRKTKTEVSSHIAISYEKPGSLEEGFWELSLREASRLDTSRSHEFQGRICWAAKWPFFRSRSGWGELARGRRILNKQDEGLFRKSRKPRYLCRFPSDVFLGRKLVSGFTIPPSELRIKQA